MLLDDLRSELESHKLQDDRFLLFGDAIAMVLDPFCIKCDRLLVRDDVIVCRRCARIRTDGEVERHKI